ncbi:uncharacterized protein BP5553_07721 [Venustampulla echinocandica]|uniref:HTH APSES-type domain-containing protein n=1 Tax=Venustampulla echinocandica TaxID=2656787 RepID=A0A370THC3_9HELO|nr:uncharacterized protein BP5553_07721 [Venustampulla echinocandica]RDL34593.1 hypothetical protein BP5553_07721 [Venustampulla echinocandica]
MVVPAFGFSFGDFTGGIVLVKELITALRDGAGAKPQYKRLITVLVNLERALTEVQLLKVEDSQAAQKIALEQAALQCRGSIEDFLRQNAKFEATLGAQTTSSKWNWRANLHKIQWVMCREDSIDKLKAEIMGHTLAINTLLMTTHLSATAIQTELTKSHQLESKEHRKVTDEAQALVKQNHALLSIQTNLTLMISRNIENLSTRQQTEELQSIVLKILDTNVKMYEMVLDMQKLQSQLPVQVDRQQPVHFEDAHGRITPFHTEFINSFDAFQAVIESISKRKLDLTASWDSVFLPGRKVNMSMVFRRPQTSMSSCPGCQAENEIEGSNRGSEIQCSNIDCKMWYQRIFEIDAPQEAPFAAPKIKLGKRGQKATLTSSRKRSKQLVIEGSDYGVENSAQDEDEDDDEIHEFRRVQVVHKNFVPKSLLQHVRRDYSMSMTDSAPSESGILMGVTSLSNKHTKPDGPQVYTAAYPNILMYEMEANGAAVMRRSSDSWLNATQILKVAQMKKGQRAKTIAREILIGEHEKIQGGYGISQGIWINYERGVRLCRQYGVEELLRPLLNYDMGVETPTKRQRVAQRHDKTSRKAMSWSGTGRHAAFSRISEFHSWRI